MAQTSLRAAEAEQSTCPVEAQAESRVVAGRVIERRGCLLVGDVGAEPHERGAALHRRHSPRMLLRFGQLAKAIRYRERLVELAELDEALDQIGRDGKHPRLRYPLALGVLPDRPEAFHGQLGLVLV